MRECLRIAFETAVERGIDTVVIFTGIGEGPEIAIKEFRPIATFGLSRWRDGRCGMGFPRTLLAV
jgi:hypothetical protein